MTRLLIIFRKGPYGSSAGQEGLDAVMAASAYDIAVCVGFVDDAVFMLKQGQEAQRDSKVYTKAFGALSDFGIDKVLVDDQSLSARGLELSDLFVDAKVVDAETLRSEIANHDQVLVF